MSTHDTTPALMSAARLAEIRERESRATTGPWRVSTQSHDDRPRTEEVCDLVNDTWVVTDHHLSNYRDDAAFIANARQDIPALLALLDALTPRDREQGGRLVRNVWIAWAKEQPSPKASWLVEWEGLSEPDREVDRRIFEACYAAGRASLTPRAPVDGEALGRAHYLHLHGAELCASVWPTLPVEVRAKFIAAALALDAHGYARGVAAGEAERAELHASYTASQRVLAEGLAERDVEIARVTEECDAERVAVLERNATIARLTAALADLPTLYDAQVRESQRLAAALERMEDERDGATAELAEARVAAFEHSAAETDKRVAAARLDGAQKERERWKAAVEALTDLRHVERDEGSTDEQIAAARDAAQDAMARATEGRQGS